MHPATIRTALGAALAELDGEIYDQANLNPLPPAIMIYPTDLGGTTAYGDTYDAQFELLLLAPTGEMESGQDTLDAWLSSTDSQSISAKLADDETLGGVVSSARCLGMIANSYSVMPLIDGGTNYLTARVLINVLT